MCVCVCMLAALTLLPSSEGIEASFHHIMQSLIWVWCLLYVCMYVWMYGCMYVCSHIVSVLTFLPSSEGMGDFIPAHNPVLNLGVVLLPADYAVKDILEAQVCVCVYVCMYVCAVC